MRSAGLIVAAAVLAVGCSNDGVTTTRADTPGPTSLTGSAAGVVALQEATPGLRAQGRISDVEARRLALQRVPGGEIVEAELEEEGGRLIYSYEIRSAGAGLVEVEIDARTGAVLSDEGEKDDDDRASGRDSDAGGR